MPVIAAALGASNALAAPSAAFFDDFTRPDGLITNKNPASPRSEKWLVTEGSLFASGGQGWTGVPDTVSPDASSSNGTGSALFRAFTHESNFATEVLLKLNVEGFPLSGAVWDGVHVYLRYQDEDNFYQVTIRRRDGGTAIKRKRAGSWSTFTTPTNGKPLGQEQSARILAENQPDGSVLLELHVDGELLARAVDASSPLTVPGKVGIGGDNVEFRFDDFTIDPSTAPLPGPDPSCLVSEGTWANRSFASQAGLFEATFDATPGAAGMDGVAGFSRGAASDYGELASIVRFNTAGFIDARDGDAYAADAPIPYDPGTAYRFRVEVDVPAHTYNAYVRSGSSSEQLFASSFSFRTEQGAVGSLDNLGLLALGGRETVCHLAVSSRTALGPTPSIERLDPFVVFAGEGGFNLTVFGADFADGAVVRWNGSPRPTTFANGGQLTAEIPAEDTEEPGLAAITVRNPDGRVSNELTLPTYPGRSCITPLNQQIPAQTSTFTARMVLVAHADGMDGIAGFSNGEAFDQSRLANILRFSPEGFIQARDGDVYAAETPIPYGESGHYFVRFEMDVASHTYSAFVHSTDGQSRNGPEVRLARDYDFNTPQSSIDALNNFAILPEGSGSISLCGGVWTTPPTSNPAPGITYIEPWAARAGDAAVALNLFGRNFIPDSTLHWDGSPRATSVENHSHLRATIPAEDLGSPAKVRVTVVNPAPGGGTSDGFDFFVTPRDSANWTAAAPPPQPRGGATATGLPDGRVLLLGGGDVETDLPAVIYDREGDAWESIGEITGRFRHASVLLNTGKVLMVGGEAFECCIGAQLFDPATGELSPAGGMVEGRGGATATLLDDGKVLVVGGHLTEAGPTASTEVYDPDANDWTAAGSLSLERMGHTATRLADGRVLVAGGDPGAGLGEATAIAEIYDPATGAWTQTGSMSTPRFGHAAALLPDGRVLVTGGRAPVDIRFRSGPLATAEIFDPAAGTWSPAPPMRLPRVRHTAAALPDGRVLVTGGGDSSAQLFDPALEDWVPAGFMTQSREGHTATLLPSGEVFVAGGSTAELFSPGPAISSLSPSSAAAGGPGFTLSVFGQRFSSGSVVEWDGLARPTTFVSVSTLTAAIAGSDISSAGTVPVTVSDPAGRSNALAFTVEEGAPPPAAFFEPFDYPDGLITNENPASPRSGKWLVEEGSLFASGGRGWTGAPDTISPDASSSNGTGSAFFRAFTHESDFATEVLLRLNVESFPLSGAVWDGVHVYLRYQDTDNFYQVTIRRRDGRTALKKKRAGSWTTFTTPTNGRPLGEEQSVRILAENQPDGSVLLELYVDGELLARAVDAASPLTAPGKVGIAGDNVEFRFDDFTIDPSTAPLPAPRSAPSIAALSPSSATAGGPGFTLSVFGQDFSTSSVVEWDGESRPTAFVSASTLTASISSSDIAASGIVQVTVLDPAGRSNSRLFTIQEGSPPPAATTVVSLTFDDERRSQLLAQDILRPRGLKGTFYINSGRVGASGRLTWSEIRSISDDGHEIGGHTIDHLDLTTLSASERERQVCDDRAAINSQGYPSTAFAYPFGTTNSDSQATVRDCGYTSARIVGGIGCPSCPKGETMPPANPYVVRTPPSIKSDTTLSDLQKYVTDAEEAGGGWLVLVFHDVCTGCGTLSVSPEILADFADWLKDRSSSGTAVLTVAEAMSLDDSTSTTAAFAAAAEEEPSGLSLAGSGSADPAFGFRDFYAFPNPSRRGEQVTIRLQVGVADAVDVNVYDVSGQLVHSGSVSGPQILDDGNGKGAQYTYDYPWDIGGVGSGVYLFAVTAQKSGESDIRRIGKGAVIK